jgi:hypothetical protein
VWTYLETWVVQDGGIPELRVGSKLIDHGVRASGWVIEPTAAEDGLELVDGPDPDGYDTPTFRLTGLVEWSRPETDEWILRCNATAFLARLSREHPLPGMKQRVTVLCALAVVPDYEWDAFAIPNVRQDWIVEGLRVEHRAREPHRDGDVPGRVVAVDDLTQMHQWDDDRGPNLSSSYLLDLRPAD